MRKTRSPRERSPMRLRAHAARAAVEAIGEPVTADAVARAATDGEARVSLLLRRGILGIPPDPTDQNYSEAPGPSSRRTTTPRSSRTRRAWCASCHVEIADSPRSARSAQSISSAASASMPSSAGLDDHAGRHAVRETVASRDNRSYGINTIGLERKAFRKRRLRH